MVWHIPRGAKASSLDAGFRGTVNATLNQRLAAADEIGRMIDSTADMAVPAKPAIPKHTQNRSDGNIVIDQLAAKRPAAATAKKTTLDHK